MSTALFTIKHHFQQNHTLEARSSYERSRKNSYIKVSEEQNRR